MRLLKIFLLIGISISILSLSACNEDEDAPTEYTGREAVYSLIPGSEFPISGVVTFKEKKSAELEVTIVLEGLNSESQHPAHLHYGDITTEGAPMAALLEPVDGPTRKSITLLSALGDGIPFTFDDLLVFEGHIKVHQDDGVNKSTVFAWGNIGAAAN